MRLNINTVFWTCTLLGCAAFWTCVVGCALHTDTPRPLDLARASALTREDYTLELVGKANSEATYLPDRYATVNVHHMPQLASVDGGLPVLLPPTQRPRAGARFVLRWLTRVVPDSSGQRPNLPVALLVSLKQPSAAQAIPGAQGAMLQVPPHYVLVPETMRGQAQQASVPLPFEFVQDGAGGITLAMQVPPQLNGLRVWCQLLVADARVAAGCVSTPMVELLVGSK